MVLSDTVKKAWQKLLGKSNEDAELPAVVSAIRGCSSCGLHEVTNWVISDADNPGLQIMTDDRIVER
jgi:hypothetical protein